MSDETRHLGLALLSIFTGVGVLLLSFVVWMVADNVAVMRTHEYALAEVVRSEPIASGSSRRLTYYSVVVRYDGPRGRRTARIERTTSQYEPGETMGVYYRPETAHKAIAGGFMSMWFVPIILGIPGLAAVFFGLRPKDLRRSPAPR